jgi:cell division protein FtsI/penicillin-binding protein 2
VYSVERPHRGNIVDRNGYLLATDATRYQIVAVPSVLTETMVISVAHDLAPLVGITEAELVRRVREAPTETVVLKYYASRAAADAVEKWQRQGLRVEYLPRRFYPEDRNGAFVVGFAQIDQNGSYGIEAKYDQFLRENGDILPTAADGQVQSLPASFSTHVPSPVGRDLVLTVDRRIQAIAEEELQSALARYKAAGGTIIVMDPKTGEILANASLPNYSPNTFYETAQLANGQDPFIDPAVAGAYEPGSVFKIVTMAAGIDSGTITPESVFRDDGVLVVGEREIRNSDRLAHGAVDIATILAKSLNIGSAQVAIKMGGPLFYNYVERFGFGNYTGVDLAGEVKGILKKQGDTTWSQSDLATNAFGQGISVTPMQMINAVAAVANHGAMMRPHVVKAVVANGQWFEIEPALYRTVVSPAAAQALTDLLVEAANVSIPYRAAMPGYAIAGKTGTAQIPSKEGYEENRTIATFVGYAPAYDPAFVVLVKLDKSEVSVWATETAAPTFYRIADRLFALLNIPPDEVRR